MQNPFDPGYYESEELEGFGFKAVGDNVRVAKNCTIIGPENIEIGDNVRIDAFTSIIAASGYLKLGCWIRIHTSCFIGCRGGVEMEDFSGLSHASAIFTATDDFSGRWMVSSGIPEEFTNPTVAPVRMSRHSILCANSSVLPGCHIGEGSIVGAMSLVTRPVDACGIYVGIPAYRLKERERRILTMAAGFYRISTAA